jgi:hypothetical protein
MTAAGSHFFLFTLQISIPSEFHTKAIGDFAKVLYDSKGLIIVAIRRRKISKKGARGGDDGEGVQRSHKDMMSPERRIRLEALRAAGGPGALTGVTGEGGAEAEDASATAPGGVDEYDIGEEKKYECKQN